MNYGLLKDYFKGACAKTLAPVDVDKNRSNQHELNGVKALKEVLGSERIERRPTKYMYFDNGECIEDEGSITWYDARENHPTRSEYRLYYSPNKAIEAASPNDELFFTLSEDGVITIIVAASGSNEQSQLNWLFGFCEIDTTFELSTNMQNTINAQEGYLLEALGIKLQPDKSAEKYLDDMLCQFNQKFPTTEKFSEYARGTLKDLDFKNDSPDTLIIECFNREDMLFKIYEEQDVVKRLEPIVRPKIQTEEVLEVTKSVLNRRKARAGKSLENHLRFIFTKRDIVFTYNPVTENKNKPDFIFPSIEAYLDPNFPVEQLTMLGAKTTAKDRWSQVLKEAERIKNKHLITLEPAISVNTTENMRNHNLQLVVPKEIQATYKPEQHKWLWSLNAFCDYVEGRQKQSA